MDELPDLLHYTLFPSNFASLQFSPLRAVAKFALKGSIKSASRKYDIPVTTVRGFVKSYKEKQSENPNKEILTVPQKKRSRHTLLPNEIGKKVMASSMRLSGAVVNYNILIVIAKGKVVTNDRTSLKEYGVTITFGWKWCESIFRRMKWTKRKCTTKKAIVPPGLIREIGLTFLEIGLTFLEIGLTFLEIGLTFLEIGLTFLTEVSGCRLIRFHFNLLSISTKHLYRLS